MTKWKQGARQAGFTRGKTDALGRPLAEAARVLPVVELEEGPDGGVLVWRWPGEGEEPEVAASDARILEEFIGLADPKAGPNAVRLFAKTYGPLMLCEHGKPYRHVMARWSPRNGLLASAIRVVDHPFWGDLLILDRLNRGGDFESSDWKLDGQPTDEMLREIGRAVYQSASALTSLHPRDARSNVRGLVACEAVQREPVAVWVKFARTALAMVRLATALTKGSRSDELDEDWREIYGGDGEPWKTAGREQRWGMLTFRVNLWLREGGVLPSMIFDGRPQMKLYADSAFGAVARQLAFAFAKVDGLEACAGCGVLFTPSRRPAAGRRSWCGDCRGREDKRTARRESAARKREEERQEPGPSQRKSKTKTATRGRSVKKQR